MSRSSTAAQAAAPALPTPTPTPTPNPNPNPNPALGLAQDFWLSARQFADAARKAAELPRAALLQEALPGVQTGRRAGRAAVRGGADQPADAATGALAEELSALGRHLDSIRLRLTEGERVTDPIDIAAPEASSALDTQAAEAAMSRRLSQGELLPSAEYVARRGISRQALSKALAAQRVFYVEVGGQRCVPAFFLDAQLERRQLEAVCKALGELPGPAKLQFFTTPKASLEGLTPLQALAQGLASRVRVAAAGFAQR